MVRNSIIETSKVGFCELSEQSTKKIMSKFPDYRGWLETPRGEKLASLICTELKGWSIVPLTGKRIYKRIPFNTPIHDYLDDSKISNIRFEPNTNKIYQLNQDFVNKPGTLVSYDNQLGLSLSIYDIPQNSLLHLQDCPLKLGDRSLFPDWQITLLNNQDKQTLWKVSIEY